MRTLKLCLQVARKAVSFPKVIWTEEDVSMQKRRSPLLALPVVANPAPTPPTPHRVHGIGDCQARPMFPHREGLCVTPGLGPPRGSEQAGQKVVLIRHKSLERQTYAQGLCALGRRLMSRPRLTFKSVHLGRKLTGCGAVWPASGCL